MARPSAVRDHATPLACIDPLMVLTADLRMAGVIAANARLSFSPALHNFWLRRFALDGVYLPLSIANPQRLASLFLALRDLGFAGCNITIPYKQAIYPLCSHLDETAKRIGSVNTVVFKPDGTIHGMSSDGAGFLAGLSAQLDPAALASLSNRPTVVLGAGGAAIAVIDALLAAALTETIVLCNRSLTRAEAVIARLQPYYPQARLTAVGLDGGIEVLCRQAILRINALPPSCWNGSVPILSTAMANVTDGFAFDLSYRTTPFLERCGGSPDAKIGGLLMLIAQAAVGFEAWFGQTLAAEDLLAAQQFLQPI